MSQHAVQAGYANQAGSGLTAQGIAPINIDTLGRRKFPNYKLTINIHGAHGGHVVEISKGGYGIEPDLHIIPEAEDFDRALGQIITHYQLKSE